MGLICELFTRASAGGGEPARGLPVATKLGQKTMSHFSNEPNVPSKCLLVTQM